jgi:nucleoside-diphosphate-sugar epimerase
VASAHVAALDAPAEAVAGRIFNVVQENYQIKELAHVVAAAVEPLVGSIEMTTTPATGRIRNYRASNARLTAATGFTPHRTVQDSVDSILEHLGEIDSQELLHPRYYNLRWMQLLTEVHDVLKPYERVF